jgi:hypothetical protein
MAFSEMLLMLTSLLTNDCHTWQEQDLNQREWSGNI